MPFYHLLMMEPECLPKASTVTHAGGLRGAGFSQSLAVKTVRARGGVKGQTRLLHPDCYFPKVICKNALHQSLKLVINQSRRLIISVSAEEIAK